MKRSVLFLAAVGLTASIVGAGCNVILGLGDYKDDCPEVEDGKPCPVADDAGVDSGLCTPGEKHGCYDGPAGTEGNGICHGGSQTCGNDGLFSACVGEVQPKPKEICGNGIDDDCNGRPDDGCPCVPGKKYKCFGADMDMEDVGDCKSGQHVCLADGMSFGLCMGDVLPKAEDYDTKGDEDCDGIPSADTLWVDAMTPAFNGNALAGTAAVDEDGNVYLTGHLDGMLMFGGKTLSPPSDGGDSFLLMVDAKGATQWAKFFPGANFGPVAFDGANKRILVAGTSSGIDFGTPGGPLPAGAFVVAFDATGNALWSSACAYMASAFSTVSAITVDDKGDVTIGGNFQGTMNCGGGVTFVAKSASSRSAFVVQFEPTGQTFWGLEWGDGSATSGLDQNVAGLAVASDRGVWVSGGIRGSVNVGGKALSAAGSKPDVLLAKLPPDGGQASFAKRYGGALSDEGAAIAVDAHDNVFITGYEDGPIDFGSGTLPTFTGDSPFVAAFDGTGTPLWSQSYGGTGASTNRGVGIGVEPNGDVLFTGSLAGSINFGSGGFVTDSAVYAFMARLEPKGSGQPPTTVWSKFYGGSKTGFDANVYPTAQVLAKRASGTQKDAVLLGNFHMAADFGAGTIAAGDVANLFLMRVAP